MSFDRLAAGAVLPEFRVSAPTPDEPPENKIHEDGLARQYGFKGGAGSRHHHVCVDDASRGGGPR